MHRASVLITDSLFFFVKKMDIVIVITLFVLICIKWLCLVHPNIDVAYGAYKSYRILLWYTNTEGERKYIILYTHK